MKLNIFIVDNLSGELEVFNIEDVYGKCYLLSYKDN